MTGENVSVLSKPSRWLHPFSDELHFEAGEIANGVGLDLVNPRDVNNHAVRGKVDECPRAVVLEGGVLLLHNGLPQGGGLGIIYRSPVRFWFHTLSGGQESDGKW
jgi:hypothetical protein